MIKGDATSIDYSSHDYCHSYRLVVATVSFLLVSRARSTGCFNSPNVMLRNDPYNPFHPPDPTPAE